jgi:DNA-binding CsgD family transcriptional regulator
VAWQANSALRSASDPAAEGSWVAGSDTHRIALLVGDAALRQALRAQLASWPELIESHDETADIVIADAALPDRDFGGDRQVLLVGGAKAGPSETAIEGLDPALILAAARVLAAGYRIVPEPTPAAPVHLSARERQVVGLLVEGASNKLIARVLDISVHTAKFHVTAVLEKLGARNRADAVAIALREGLVML